MITADGLNKYGLHPYTGEWSHLATRATAVQAWMPMPPFDEVDDEGHIKFDPSKYKTAKHSGRELMGWDAAIAQADQGVVQFGTPEPVATGDGIRWCVLTEGPLDAARIGPGALCIMGKSLSQENAAKIASNSASNPASLRASSSSSSLSLAMNRRKSASSSSSISTSLWLGGWRLWHGSGRLVIGSIRR